MTAALPPGPAGLAALVAARICHDLVNPLGAVGNGLELLALAAPGGRAAGPEMALAGESLAAARARLRFFRIAYGAPGEGAGPPPGEIAALLADLTRGGRLAIDWAVEGAVARDELRLAFLLLQCAESAMAWGGRLSVTRGAEGFRIRGEARRLRIEPAHWEALSDPDRAEGLGPAEVQFLLAALELRARGRRLVAELAPDRLDLAF